LQTNIHSLSDTINMAISKRYNENPILHPLGQNAWEAEAVFNGCPIREGGKTHLFYRAMSAEKYNEGAHMSVSSIGHTTSTCSDNFKNRTQLIKPSEVWDRYGCEDPRVTKIGNKYYIFYTALSTYPFKPEGIKIGVGVTRDLKKIEKHQVTTFNSKAMALFPEKINGKYVAILTANTDTPPANIALAFFNRESDIWSKRYWNSWYDKIEDHKINFEQDPADHIEIGAAPIKLKEGWLLIYSYITNYFRTDETIFKIKAVLLDLKDPHKIIGRTGSLLLPEETYELYGKVPNIVFPSGGFVTKDELHIYYGAADTVCCAAKFRLKDVVIDLLSTPKNRFSLKKYKKNPIISPKPNHKWEEKYTFNPGAIYEGGKFYIVYRAMDRRNKSVLGYASSKDGFTIDERLEEPIYTPREGFEIRAEDGFSGCEDPRLVKIDNKIYMFYTAYDGINPPSVALTSIKTKDFLAKKWNWTKPKLISPLRKFNKNACVFPEKINGKYAILHRINNSIDFHYADNLNFEKCELCEETNWARPRKGRWDSKKVGITGPPVKTKHGWLLIYHGVSDNGTYRLGAMLLKLNDPEEIIARTEKPILAPSEKWEKEGQVNNVVFSCGVVLLKDTLYVYYGGADKKIGVATVKLKKIIRELKGCVY